MKKLLSLAFITGVMLTSCTKKSNPTPAPTNVVEYTFSADNPGNYVMNYYDGVSLGTAQSITTSTWSQKITIPTGTKTANIFFTAAEGAPFYTNNTGTVTIKVNGNTVATGSMQFTNSSQLAQATYTYTAN
jgi:hypothetical protein